MTLIAMAPTRNDIERVSYLHGHLAAAARAIRDGANLAGYYVWSLLDNFEWAWRYQRRFGIVFVDFGTQRRIPRASAWFYADVIRANAVSPAATQHQVARLDRPAGGVEGWHRGRGLPGLRNVP